MLKDAKLVEMKPTTFVAEDGFQRLLADFPALLAGTQIDSVKPRKWLLVNCLRTGRCRTMVGGSSFS